jgi:hypothetical protein
MKEIWKDIKNYEGLYQVSNLGRVRSLDRVVKHGNRFRNDKGKILSVSVTPEGYPQITLCRDNKKHHVKIHRIVALTFMDKIDETYVVNHKDGNKKNNCLDNLEWVSYSRNVKHALENELSLQRGQTHDSAKLRDIDIPTIKKLRNEYNLNLKTIALIYGVHRVTIGDIINGRTWAHIQ